MGTDEETKKKVDEIHRAIVGNPFDPKAPPGVLTQLERHSLTLYGNDNEQQIGLVQKVNDLWDGKTKVLAIGAFVLGVFGFLAWLIPMLFKIGHS